MKRTINDTCPCESGEKYKKCCQAYHKGKIPKNALLLMKSRYSAYAYNDANYIIKTTHQDNIEYTNDIKQWKSEIEDFSKNTQFESLQILSFVDGEDEAYVKFKACLKIDGEDASFIEESRFLKVGNRWLYHSAKIS